MVVFFLDGWPRFGRTPPQKEMFRNILFIIFEIFLKEKICQNLYEIYLSLGKCYIIPILVNEWHLCGRNSLKKTTIHGGFFRNRRFQVGIIG